MVRKKARCLKCGAMTVVDPDACEAYGWPACCGETMSATMEEPMRVIIAGSRSITDYSLVEKAVKDSGFRIDVVISGGARGVDSMGEEWASKNGKTVQRFIPDWERHGKSAGFIRNDLMVRNADALVAVFDGVSRGTSHTISMARKKGIPVHVLEYKEKDIGKAHQDTDG